MSTRLILLAALLASAGAATLWWWLGLCERDCEVADRQAQDLFQRGEPLAALSLVDRVDARCNCARFTAGDAPPQYALAQACLRQLHSEGRSAEVHQLLARARGPILKALASQRINDPSH